MEIYNPRTKIIHLKIVDEILKNQMSVELYFNEYDEVKITLYKDGIYYDYAKNCDFKS